MRRKDREVTDNYEINKIIIKTGIRARLEK